MVFQMRLAARLLALAPSLAVFLRTEWFGGLVALIALGLVVYADRRR